jgi:hypothetical protein
MMNEETKETKEVRSSAGGRAGMASLEPPATRVVCMYCTGGVGVSRVWVGGPEPQRNIGFFAR